MSLTIKEKRKKIQTYIDTQCSDILLFKRHFLGGGRRVSIPKVNNLPNGKPDIDNLVRNIFSHAEEYYSYNPVTKECETSYGRSRSSIDVWRHAKSVLPDIDIFTIMESIYNIREGLDGDYCRDVMRSVFDLLTNEDWEGVFEFRCEEYGINFSDWEKLH